MISIDETTANIKKQSNENAPIPKDSVSSRLTCVPHVKHSPVLVMVALQLLQLIVIYALSIDMYDIG